MYSVLYVDDEPELLEIGQIYLQKYWNLSVTTVSSAQDALSSLNISTFDIIVSDYQMPEMDGISFLKTLRDSKHFVPFILFTGKGREEVVIEALNNGADFYLQKGGEPKAQYAELVNMIQKAVEKRRAELELLRVHHQSKMIINHLPDPTFVISTDGYLIAWNRAIEKVTGYSEQEMLSIKLRDCSQRIFGIPRLSLADHIFNPDSRIQEWYENIIHEEDTITAETIVCLGSGGKRNVWVKASPLYDENDQLIGVVETLRDITLIKQNELDLARKSRALDESARTLQNIIDFIPDPTFAIDNNGTVIAWNRAIERMTQKNAIDILGHGNHAYAEPFYSKRCPTLIDLALQDHPEIRTKYDFIKNEHDHLIAEVQNDQIYAGKRAFLWAIVAPLYNGDGNISGAIESIRDITEKKELELQLREKVEDLASSYEEIAAPNEEIRTSFDEIEKQKSLLEISEKRFRSFIEHLPDGVIIHRDDAISYANPMACQILGYDDLSCLMGRSPLDVVHPECREKINDRISRAAETKHPFIEGKFLRMDSTEIPVEIAEIPVYIDDSMSVMTIFRDITEEYERKSALRQAQNKVKILSSITQHDIKNELGTVMTILDLVSSGDIPQEEAELIKRAIDPCTNILEQLKTTFEYQTIGVMEPGWFTLSSLGFQAARHHKIHTSFYTFKGEDARIFADPLISKVFENLIDNSLRHGKNVSQINLYGARGLHNLKVVYEDDGVGISYDDKNRIFEEGFGKNTGLGLFLIKEILAMTGISICECGEPGQGVRFEMNIPQGKWE